MSRTILIIDGNNLAFKCYQSFARSGFLTNSFGVPTTLIFGFVNSLKMFAEKNKVSKTIVCWDVGGGSKFRKKLFPSYKGNRRDKKEDLQPFFDELVSLRGYLQQLGVSQMVCQGIEADDVIGWVACRSIAEGSKVIVYSDDRDYFQLLRFKGIKIWRPVTGKLHDRKMVEEELGCSVKLIPNLDALVGQDKDNIPGACELDEKGVMKKFGFGPAKAIKLLLHPENKGKTLRECREILKSADCPISSEHKKQLLKRWKQVRLSFHLAKIRTESKEYNDEEMKMLTLNYIEAHRKIEIQSSDVVRLCNMLDIRSKDVVSILKSVGVNVKGNERTKQCQVKT
jgi:DNA polymerase-1